MKGAELWRRRYAAHQPVNGVCPICEVRRCRIRADAFADLLVTGNLPEPPRTVDRPHPTAGEARRTA